MTDPDTRVTPVQLASPSAVDRVQRRTLLDLLILLGRYRAMIVGFPVAVAVVSAAISFVLPKWYTATARILPPQQQQSAAAALLSQAAGGALAGVAASSLGIKNPNDLYIGMLRSDTVTDALIARFDLKALSKKKYQADVRRWVQKHTAFESAKSGFIIIEVEAPDPRLAAEMANGYVEELHKLTRTVAVTEASQRRFFFEQQLEQVKSKLADGEVAVRTAMDSGGLASVDAQGRAIVEMVARLRAQISAKEVQLGAMHSYATGSNPDLVRTEHEIASMREQLEKLESGLPYGAEGRGAGDTTNRGASGAKSLRLLRDVKYQEFLFELLSKQYELARLDESKDAPIIQAVDRASPPEKRSSPRRAQIVILSFFGAFFASSLVAFTLDALEAARNAPGGRSKVDTLRMAWLGRKHP